MKTTFLLAALVAVSFLSVKIEKITLVLRDESFSKKILASVQHAFDYKDQAYASIKTALNFSLKVIDNPDEMIAQLWDNSVALASLKNCPLLGNYFSFSQNNDQNESNSSLIINCQEVANNLTCRILAKHPPIGQNLLTLSVRP